MCISTAVRGYGDRVPRALGRVRGDLEGGFRAALTIQSPGNDRPLHHYGVGEPGDKRQICQTPGPGPKLGCTCFSEPNAGSDLSSIETTIQDKGDHFLINGSKTWISNGTVADYAIVYATFDPNLKHKGLCAVVLETDQPGWKTRETPKLGDKSSPIAEIHLDNVVAPKENLLGKWGEGFKVAMTALDRGRISVGSGAVGLAQACLDASVEYANQRVQFGKQIAHHQLVKGTIAEMVSHVEASRLLVRQGAWLNDQDRPFTREIAIAKYFAGEAVVKAAGMAMEIHGGMGYSLEMPVRDTTGTQNSTRWVRARPTSCACSSPMMPWASKRPTGPGCMCPVTLRIWGRKRGVTGLGKWDLSL